MDSRRTQSIDQRTRNIFQGRRSYDQRRIRSVDRERKTSVNQRRQKKLPVPRGPFSKLHKL